MTRGLRALAAVLATGLIAAAGTAAAAADDGSGPVATPPPAPAVKTVTGVAANGLQVALSLPKQLPLDLAGRTPSPREIDVTVTDTGGQGYTGEADATVTAEGSGLTRTPLALEHYDAAADTWRKVPAAPGTGMALAVAETVTVPAGGSATVRLRVAAGTSVLDDVKVSATVNGASAVGSTPVTEPAFTSSGLTAGVRAGAPATVTGQLTNPTDVDYEHVPVKLYLKACAPGGACLGAADVKLEAKVGQAWKTVPLADDPSVAGGLSGTVFPDVSLAPGGSVQLTARMTLNPGAAAVGPVPLGFGPMGLTIADRTGTGGTLTVQPATPTPTPTPTPMSTSTSTSAPSSPSQTPSSSDSASSSSSAPATPSATASTPATAPTQEVAAAGTPGPGGSSSATVLVAAGLFAVCLALVLVWALIKRRERAAAAHAAAARDDYVGADHD